MLTSAFHGLLGAGFAYYGFFLLPARVSGQWWARVAGLLAAAAAIVIGAGLSAPRIAVGIAVVMVALWLARRIPLAATPETTAGLQSQGYLPYGVGLTIAAGLLQFSGAMPLVRDVVLEYGRLLGAA